MLLFSLLALHFEKKNRKLLARPYRSFQRCQESNIERFSKALLPSHPFSSFACSLIFSLWLNFEERYSEWVKPFKKVTIHWILFTLNGILSCGAISGQTYKKWRHHRLRSLRGSSHVGSTKAIKNWEALIIPLAKVRLMMASASRWYDELSCSTNNRFELWRARTNSGYWAEATAPVTSILLCLTLQRHS